MRRIASLIVIALVCVASFATPSASFAQSLDVIRGRVTGPDTAAIQGVTIKATSYSGNVSKTTRTDKNGKFSITYPDGEGDYWLEFSAIGFQAKRFEVKRVADEPMLLADTRLTSSIATLDAVNVKADGPRALVNRNAQSANAGGGEKSISNANLPPDQMGNLAAMAASLPGIQLIPGLDGAADVFSALGLSADQNATTFNGLGSGINTLPADAQVGASVATYSYDPSIGNFSGGRIQIQTFPGTNYSNRQASSNARAPQLQFADDVAEAQNQKYTNVSIGAGGRGPITMDRNFYNSSFQYGRNYKDLPSLLNTSALGLTSAGVAHDSVTRLLDILSGKGIPAFVSSAPKNQITDNISLQNNLDITPSTNGTGNGITIGMVGNYSKSQQIGGNSILTTPAHNGEAQSWTGLLSLKHSNYFWDSFLSTTNVGFNFSGNDNSPYLRSPSGNVRINSLLDDSTSAVRVLSFGGNPFLDNTSRSYTAELTNSIRWYAGNNRHSVMLMSDVRHESFTADQNANLKGSFSFNSLADLQAGTPSSFTRTLFAPDRKGSQLSGAFSLGDTWRPTTGVSSFLLQYGVRVDFNHLLDKPLENPLVEQKLGVRNDFVPNSVYFSPRLGFTWIYGKQDQIAFVPGAARPQRALIQGGVGVFQNVNGVQLLSNAINNTGLASSTQSLTCLGPAAPAPSWNTYELNPSSIPSTCADGTGGSTFSNSTPNVSLFDSHYQQQRSWRGNLSWKGPILDNRFAVGVLGLYSMDLHQQDAVDINLNNTQQFTLENENGRPVFAHLAAIDPTTGVVASKDTRVTTDLLRVSETRSDLRRTAGLVQLAITPVTANPKLRWNASYQFQPIREKYRGFSSTVGDPFATQWGQGLQNGRHRIGVGFQSIPVYDVVYITWNLGFSSGTPFTPSISGDVNGDGNGNNDRAFVFNPTTVAPTDAAFAAGMKSLLDNGAPAAKKCLTNQLGKLASRGSCMSPWTADASINFAFNPQKIGLPKRTTINFSINNPLGLADLIVHGQDIHGWGQPIAPDPNLLFVRGFDPSTKAFKYEVNQRFGSTRPNASTQRALPLVSLRVVLDIGTPRERQFLTQRLDVGRGKPGTKATAPTLKSMGSSTIPNPMALILQQPDSLKLTRKQADSLAVLSRLYTQKADALWSPVSKDLEGLPEQYNNGKAYDEYVIAREKTVDYLITLVPDVKKLLTASQKRKLPQQIMNYLDVRVLKFLRSSSSGDGSAVFYR
ncbi:MAG: carboxypeptidase-like regulatory domain-containing protein [Gemmatimonadaceae bacterium]